MSDSTELAVAVPIDAGPIPKSTPTLIATSSEGTHEHASVFTGLPMLKLFESEFGFRNG